MQTEMKIPWMAIMAMPPRVPSMAEAKGYHGDGHDVLLQGFHWHSCRGAPHAGSRRSWYRVLTECAPTIRAAGFSWIWMPPASDSLAPEGYIPRRWHVLNSAYGSEEELRAALQALGPVKALADVILNHRVGVATGGADFADPAFPDDRAAIARNDESGVGTGNPDSGELNPVGRDLDHTNSDVRAAIKHYLRRLKAVGFRGWRYDLVKGFHGRFVGEYNEDTAPEFSVGECFDGDRQKVTNWIDATGGRSTAFDFPTRFLLYEALKNDQYGPLRSHSGGRAIAGGVIGYWPSRAVTFIDNHDTEYRRDGKHGSESCGADHFPGKTVEEGYAYILTHPGIPCVFWSHFFDWGHSARQTIEKLMRIRKECGIHATSTLEIVDAGKGLYAARIDGRVALKLGTRDWWPGGGWQLALSGERFAVWTRGRA
jgi:alpha-amylase